MKKLIKNVMIVSMDENENIIDKGYILIDGEKIAEVKSGEYSLKQDSKDIEIIDGEGYCALPGLFNCHTHAAMTILRGYGEGLPLMRWLNEKIWPMEAKFKEKHIEMGTQLACIEMLRSGTVAFNDMYFYQEKVMEVAEKFNIKAVIGIPLIGDNWRKQLKEAQDLSEKVKRSNSKLVKSMFAPHATYTLTKEALKEVADAAKSCRSSIHIHVAETNDEAQIIKDKYNMTPCELLEETGIFDNHTVSAHCVHLNDNDIDIIKRHDVNPVYNPQSNMKLASGISPAAGMMDKGINVCLGTDGASSNNNLNMFEEMETGAMLQKLYCKDATKLDAASMLKMATVNGAKALQYENDGAIKKGNYADIILININKPNMIPVIDICSNIVFSANGSEVEYVIINGKTVIDKGNFVYIDEEKVLYECKKFIKELYSSI